MKFPLSFPVLLSLTAAASAQYIPPDPFFSGGGPAYSPAPQRDIFTEYNPGTILSAGYQWWGNNVPEEFDLRNGPAPRLEYGDLPAVPFEMADLRLPWAWTMTGPGGTRLTGAGVKIAIIDNGIDAYPPDFVATGGGPHAMDTEASHHRNFKTGTASPQPMNPATDTHGTALAGIIAARHDGGGLAGIAPSSVLQSLVAVKANITPAAWAEAFSYGTSLTDTDSDGTLLDETRTGSPNFDICVNAASDGVSLTANDLFPEDLLWHRSIMRGAVYGRGNKGCVYITSAGSGAIGHMNTNYAEQKNSIFQIPVTAVTDMGRRIGNANPGASIVCAGLSRGEELPPAFNWLSAPSGFPFSRSRFKSPPVEPDDLPWQWWRRSQGVPVLAPQAAVNFNYYGTGTAAAQVAGIVALMLEKRPDLQARDIKEILLRSGRVVNDARYDLGGQPLPYEPNGPGSAPQQTYPWPAAGPHPPPTLAEGPTQWRMSRLGRPLHHALGAGLIDAHRALKIAERWVPLPVNPLRPVLMDALDPNFGSSINKRNRETGGLYFGMSYSAIIRQDGVATEVLVPGPPEGMRVEDIEVRVRCYHPRRGDLEIKLIAPGSLAWDGTGREMVSQLLVPHREDYHDDHYDQNDPAARKPLDWTFSTVRYWGMTVHAGSTGNWRLSIRDAINKGTTTSATADDPVIVPVQNPTDTLGHRLEGIAIVMHGTYPPPGLRPWDPPAIATSVQHPHAAAEIFSFPLTVQPLGLASDGQPAFPVTSWDFFNLPDIVPVHAAALVKSPFEYYPYGENAAPGVPPEAALYPTLNQWPAQPVWVPLTTPSPAGGMESSGAVVSRPRWAELSPDGRFLVLRNTSSSLPAQNFIHVRLNRATGMMDVLPRHPGTYRIRVIAESLIGISQPKEIVIVVSSSRYTYGGWRYLTFTPAQFEDSAISSPEADPDGDGQNNFLEFCLHTDPLDLHSRREPQAGIQVTGLLRHATLTFTRSRLEYNTHAAKVQFSNDLQTWDVPATFVSYAENADDTITEVWRTTEALTEDHPPLFGRVRFAPVP